MDILIYETELFFRKFSVKDWPGSNVKWNGIQGQGFLDQLYYLWSSIYKNFMFGQIL